MKETYIVTGASGHLGSAIVNDLLKMGKNIRGFCRSPHRHSPFKEKIKMVYGDITNPEDVDRLFQDLTGDIYVIHCAGIVSISSFFDKHVYHVNVNGVKNIVSSCLKYQVKKFIHVGSVHAIPVKKKGQVMKEVDHFDPKTVVGTYAKSKAEGCQYVLDSVKRGLNATIVLPSGIIGPYDYGNNHLTRLLIDYLNDNLKAIIHGGYDFVDVRDVSKGIISAIYHGEKGQSYILGNRYITIKELIDLTAKISGKKEINTVLPIWFAKSVAFLAEIYYKIRKTRPLFTAYSLYTLKVNSLFSHELARDKLQYHPRDFEDTLKDTIDFIKKNKLK